MPKELWIPIAFVAIAILIIVALTSAPNTNQLESCRYNLSLCQNKSLELNETLKRCIDIDSRQNATILELNKSLQGNITGLKQCEEKLESVTNDINVKTIVQIATPIGTGILGAFLFWLGVYRDGKESIESSNNKKFLTAVGCIIIIVLSAISFFIGL